MTFKAAYVDWNLAVDRFALTVFILVCILAGLAAVCPDVLLSFLASLAKN
jgi:hypothetical protein